MSDALVLALPGLLCAVTARDLSRPAAYHGDPVDAGPVDVRRLAVAGVLAATAGVALAAAVLLPLGGPPPTPLPAGATGAVALVLATRPPAGGPRRTATTPAHRIARTDPA
jgi:hypothetical protein